MWGGYDWTTVGWAVGIAVLAVWLAVRLIVVWSSSRCSASPLNVTGPASATARSAADSAGEESFEDGLLEYPHYTRPASWTGPDGIERQVPEILVSGHHGRVAEWRMKRREEITRRRRPDLWARRRTATGTEEK